METSTHLLDHSRLFFYFEFILAFASVMGILSKILKIIFVYVKKQVENNRLMKVKIDKIFEEITPNHGSSIKDTVNKMHKELESHTKLIELLLSRQRWSLDASNDMIFESDENGENVWVNKRYIKLMKTEMDNLLHHNWKNFILEKDRDRIVESWNNCVKQCRLFDETYHMIDGEGSVYKVHCTAKHMPNHGYIGSIEIIK